MINRRFIKNWIPDDQDNPEEDKYKAILKTIQEQDLRIDKNTFQKLYDWKARRSKKYLDLNKYKLYESAFNEISDLKDEEKIKFYMKTKERRKLSGILDPVASTILHFMYPDKFPIKDVRTIGTLRDKDLLGEKVSYKDYRTEIFKIYDNCKGEFSLRQIDRALFTYNEKKELLISVLEGKKSIDDVAKHLIAPQERIMELIMDLENHFKEKLLKLNKLKTELGMS
ncbi:MAG: hypothetical protein KJI71_02200 [Patescibacteria group bacterium]|nr:hypothetical protein [Patescibacteria group bacterium]